MHKSFSNEELGYILFNNRSAELTRSFCNDRAVQSLCQFGDSIYNRIHDSYRNNFSLKINKTEYEFNDIADDIIFTQDELSDVDITELAGNFNATELEFVTSRGLSHAYAMSKGMFGLSNLAHVDDRLLDILGVSMHPTIREILLNDLSSGLCMPHYENGRLRNLTTRRTVDNCKMKYSQAVPGLSVYHELPDASSKTLYLVEGVLDMHALSINNRNSASVSSAFWNIYQLMWLWKYVIEPNGINTIIYWCDDDETGHRSGCIIRDLFTKFKKFSGDIKLIASSEANDASEHLVELQLHIDDVIDISDMSYTASSYSEPFDVTQHLLKRQF